MQKIITEIVQWLKYKTTEANANGLVVGLSGGLDSAVVANLIKRAYPENSLAVIMPLNSNPVDLEHAIKVAAISGIKHITVDLSETHRILYKEIKQSLPKTEQWNEENDRIADANLRARLRMSTLYTLATNYQYLVVGTDNAAEWHTGYFTKYGDGGVDLQPIVDLTKTEVREMASALDVPKEIIDKVPSADLWVGQSDEEEMGTSYTMIDHYLDGREIPEKDRILIEGMHQRTEHKRQIAPQFRFKS